MFVVRYQFEVRWKAPTQARRMVCQTLFSIILGLMKSLEASESQISTIRFEMEKFVSTQISKKSCHSLASSAKPRSGRVEWCVKFYFLALWDRYCDSWRYSNFFSEIGLIFNLKTNVRFGNSSDFMSRNMSPKVSENNVWQTVRRAWVGAFQCTSN